MPTWAGRLSRFFSPLLPLCLSAGLLTLSFAPISQFYLAWIGLIPWLVFLSRVKSQKSAFLWSWVAGTIFFSANMWWMALITGPGMIALMVYCGIYWGFAALVIRGADLLNKPPAAAVAGIAAIWVACEWLRGNLMTGLPWLFLGHTQSPILPMCQIADFAGAYGISFWVVAVNALGALIYLRRPNLKWAIIEVGALTAATLIYGIFRIQQTPGLLVPGPEVAVIQPNFPQSTDGSKGALPREILQLHRDLSLKALQSDPGNVDLIVWSETMLPPINKEAMDYLQTNDNPPMTMADIRREVGEIAETNHVAMLVGGEFNGDWVTERRDDGIWPVAKDRRNTAYFFDREGQMDDSPGHRYDKVHLVPWGEFIPGKFTFPFLYKLSLFVGPHNYADYVLQPGSLDSLTVFHVNSNGQDWRFVTPICFEDIDPRVCSAMFRPVEDDKKRADFLVNITNDGWFKANQNAQHLQAAIFRSIENRVPTARAVNTGISGFIDSTGRVVQLLPVRTADALVSRLMIDPRLTFYTDFGDVFASACIVAAGIMAVIALSRRFLNKRRTSP